MKCPNCGQNVPFDKKSPEALLEHVERSLQGQKQWYERITQGDEKANLTEKQKKYREKRRAAIAKWEAWRDWVAQKIEEQQGAKKNN
jgi:hypothetical protein